MRLQHGATVPLWNDAPFDTSSDGLPTITPFFPEHGTANGKSIIIFPGGGYNHFGAKEGDVYAKHFNKFNYTCFVVKYRIHPEFSHPAQLADALRAVRVVRAAAGDLGLRSDRIGVIGSSAGGHLAAMASTLFEEAIFEKGEDETISSRPDFTILCYPVITLCKDHCNRMSRKCLLGDKEDDAELRAHLSCELAVSEKTPPAFIWHTFEDESVPVENAMMYADSLRKFNIPFELHIYKKGSHGIALGDNHPWSGEAVRFMDELS